MVAATAPSTPKPNGLNMISRRSLATSVAGAMVAALLALSGLPANAGDDGASPTTDKDAKATLAQSAVARAEQLSPLMDLDGAGKIVVDEAMGRVTISWNGKPPSEVSSQLGTDSNGVTVDAALTEYSMDALKKAMDRIWAAESESLNIVAIEPTEALDGLVVYAATNSESARSSAERSLDAAVEPSVEVVSMAKERMPLASRQNDSAPWQGGGRLLFAANSNRCTTGFTVVKPDGTGRILTSGHCNWGAGSRVNDGAGDMIAPAGTSQIKKNFDSLLIDPNGGTIGEVFRGPQDAPGTNEAVVSGSAAPAQGTSVCVSGAATGEHCANVEIGNTGVEFDCGAIADTRRCTGFVVKNTNGGVASGTGDSGAPIYSVKADNSLGARGIVTEGNSNFIVTCNANVWGNPVCTSRFWAVSTETLKNQWGVVMDVE